LGDTVKEDVLTKRKKKGTEPLQEIRHSGQK